MGHRLCCQTPSKMKHHLCGILLAALSLLGGAWPALAQVTLGRNHVVVAAYQPPSRLKPDPAEAEYNLGVALGKRGHWQDAVGAYQEGIRLQPGDTVAHYNLGVAYSNLKRSQDAVAAYQQVIRLKPADARAHLGLAAVYLMLGDRGAALEEYTILKTLDQSLAEKLFSAISQ